MPTLSGRREDFAWWLHQFETYIKTQGVTVSDGKHALQMMRGELPMNAFDNASLEMVNDKICQRLTFAIDKDTAAAISTTVLNDCKAFMAAVKEHHNSSSRVNLVTLRRQVYTPTPCAAHQDPEQWVIKRNKDMEDLRSHGVTIDEVGVAVAVLEGLPPNWEGFKSSLRRDEGLSMRKLIDEVKVEKQRLGLSSQGLTGHEDQVHKGSGLVFTGKPGIYGPEDSTKRKQENYDEIKCFKCGKYGHKAHDCELLQIDARLQKLEKMMEKVLEQKYERNGRMKTLNEPMSDEIDDGELIRGFGL